MKALRGVDFTKYILSTITVGKWLIKKPCKFVKKNSFYASNFFMHISNMSVSNMHCLTVIVWSKYEQNQTKTIKVIVQNP